MDPWRAFVDALPREERPQRLDPIRLVCFDLDGVLTDQESSWVAVHEHFGLRNDESLHAFLHGQITEEEFIRRDVALWQRKHAGVTGADIERILDRKLTLSRGAKSTVSRLRGAGVVCAIVSGGIDLAAHAAGRALGIPHVSANALHVDEHGRLTGGGTVNTPLRDKGRPVRRFAELLRIPLGHVASVGNSSPDIGMFRASGLAIAYRPSDEFVKEAADLVLPGRTLTEVLEPILSARAAT